MGAPLAGFADEALLLARLIMGVVMLHYGVPKLRDPRKHVEDFVQTGFRPAWFWGMIIAVVEGVGIWKVAKAGKPFPDYSYDLLLLALVLLAFGPGRYSIA